MLFGSKKIPITEIFPEDFIDIHSHLLPGIDDGSKNMDNSIELIEKLVSNGIKRFITTPHTMAEVYPNTPEIILQKRDELRIELKKRNINVSLDAASEYLLDHDFYNKLKAGDVLTFGKSKYILVEMSFFNAPNNLKELLFEIQLAGLKPVMAHPERYNFYGGKIEEFRSLKNYGCKFQLNLLSLTSHYGKQVQKTSYKLLEEGLYDFVGTDTHHTGHTALLRTIATKKNKKYLRRLVLNNCNILD